MLYRVQSKHRVMCVVLAALLVVSSLYPLRGEAAVVTHVTVSPTTLVLVVGANATVVATVHPAVALNRSVTWASSNEAVATVNAQGRVTGESPGLAIITVTTTDGARTASVAVSVVPPPVRVTGVALSQAGVALNPANRSLTVGQTDELDATVSPANASNPAVVWSSSNSQVAAVNVHGLVTAVSPGLAIISVTTVDGNFTAQTVVEVAVLIVPSTDIVITPPSTPTSPLPLAIGASVTLSAFVKPHNATNRSVVWASHSPLVAAVSASGVVTALSPGDAVITATNGDGRSGFADIHVPLPPNRVTGITTPPGVVALTTGMTRTITATILPSNATIRLVRWASNNPFVATVNATGVITAVSPGVASVSVTTLDGGFVSWVTVQVTMPVVPVTGVTIVPTTLSLVTGQTGVLTPTVAPANATNRAVTWDSTNVQVATVNESGVVIAVAPGSTVITVRTSDGGRTATANVTVTAPIVLVTGVAVAPASLNLVVRGTATLTSTVAPANATNRAVTWASADTRVATVNATGVVTAVAPGNTIITVRTTDGGRTATATVTVASPIVLVTGVTVAPTTLSLVVGGTGSLAATVTPANATNRAVTWASADMRVATVNASGVVTAVSPGLTVVSVTTADGGRTAAVAVTVAAPAISVASVVLAPAILTLPVGQSSALVAMVQPENAANRAVTWASSQPLVAAVDARGIVTALSVGSAIITVTTVDGGHTAESSMVVVPPRAEMPIDPTATTILTLPDRASVVVPSGAISGVNARLLAEVVPVAPTSPLLTAASRAQLMPVSEIMQLTLSGGTLDRNLHLSQRFVAEQVPAGQVAALHVYNARTQRWIYLGGQVVDGAVTVGLADFGQFAVLATRPLPPLSDISNHWAQRPISTLSGMHIIGGHRDGTFRPDTQVSRAEFVAMLARALYLPEDANAAAHFRDAGTFSWAAGAIGAATKAGLVGGNADGNFAPARHISRAEIAVVLSRVVQQGLVTVPRVPAVNFADQHTIPAWAVSGVRIAAEAGLVHGAGDGRFNPNNFVTRAEVATMLYRLVAAR